MGRTKGLDDAVARVKGRARLLSETSAGVGCRRTLPCKHVGIMSSTCSLFRTRQDLSLTGVLMSSLQFWKPGTTGPGSTLDRATETEENVISSAPLLTNVSIQSARERLPIFKHRKHLSPCSLNTSLWRGRSSIGEKLLYCIERYGVTIVVGQTGCGKTTRQFLSLGLRATLTCFTKNYRNICTRRVGQQTEMLLPAHSHVESPLRQSLDELQQKSVLSSETRYVYPCCCTAERRRQFRLGTRSVLKTSVTSNERGSSILPTACCFEKR